MYIPATSKTVTLVTTYKISIELANCLTLASCSNFFITLLITSLAVPNSFAICLCEILKGFLFVTITFSFK